MCKLSLRLSEVRSQIHNYCRQQKRHENDIRLVAVSKRHKAAKIARMHELGQRDFGENYLQEALDKMQQLQEIDITWHFIGHIQSRKCKQIAEYFDWVHTVTSTKVADKLNANRHGPALNVLIQLNLQDEDSKSGILPHELLPLAEHIMTLPALSLRGLMIIPKADNDLNKQLEVFSQCAQLLKELRIKMHTDENMQHHPLDQLSMGMSNDMATAIAAGSTMLRIGTALFGEREK